MTLMMVSGMENDNGLMTNACAQALLETNRKKVKVLNEALKCRQDRSLEATLGALVMSKEKERKEKSLSGASAPRTPSSAPRTPGAVPGTPTCLHNFVTVPVQGPRDNGEMQRKCLKCGVLS